jgi:hypothetical protein
MLHRSKPTAVYFFDVFFKKKKKKKKKTNSGTQRKQPWNVSVVYSRREKFLAIYCEMIVFILYFYTSMQLLKCVITLSESIIIVIL